MRQADPRSNRSARSTHALRDGELEAPDTVPDAMPDAVHDHDHDLPLPAAQSALIQARIRPTRTRLLVMAVLLDEASESHCLSPEAIYARIRHTGEQVGVTQIYNVLARLEMAGFVDRYKPIEGSSVYTTHRAVRFSALVICSGCKRIRGLRSDRLLQAMRQEAATHGVELVEQCVVFQERCAACGAGR